MPRTVRAEVVSRLFAAPVRAEGGALVVALAGWPAGVLLQALAGWAGLAGPTTREALPWMGAAGGLLLLLAVGCARLMAPGRRAEQELVAALPLAALALLLAEKLRWILVHLGWGWAGGPRARALLGPAAEQLALPPELAVPATVLALLWVVVAWLRIERARALTLAREARWAAEDRERECHRAREPGHEHAEGGAPRRSS